MDGAEEVSGGLIVAGRNRSVLLELTIEILHEVARLVQFLVVEALNLSITLGRNDELFPAGGKQRLDDALVGVESSLSANKVSACIWGRSSSRHLADHGLAPKSGRRPADFQGRRPWRGFWCSIRLCCARSPGLRHLFLSAGAVLMCARTMVLSIISVFVVRIGRQHFEDLLPCAALGPARENRV